MTKINSWTRANIFLGCAVALWRGALAPGGKLGKGTALTLALCSTIQLIRESKELILTEAVAIANAAMQKELTQTEIALRTHQTEQELQHLYSANIPVASASIYTINNINQSVNSLQHQFNPRIICMLP